MQLPEHVIANRKAWSEWAEPDFAEPGRRAWQSKEIVWGIWNLPETEIGGLGDLGQYRNTDIVELGCGTAYFSAWFARLGARPVGVDITPAQLANARRFQDEFDLHFPLIEASAEDLPLADASFDIAFSEYGASIWCDPYRWIPEAARVLRPGGRLIFFRNGTLSLLCMPDEGSVKDHMVRPMFGMNRLEWEGAVEFQLPHGAMMGLLKSSGFVLENLIEIQAPDGATTRFDYMTPEWARQWPSEELWVARLD